MPLLLMAGRAAVGLGIGNRTRGTMFAPGGQVSSPQQSPRSSVLNAQNDSG